MLAQILAISIFIVMFVLIIFEIFERHLITLAGAALTLLLVFGLSMHSTDAIFKTLNLQTFLDPNFWLVTGHAEESSTGINWSTIIFIAGMMIMVEGMARVGFFRWLCLQLAKMVNYKIIPIFITFMLVSFFLAMFIDSITVILFLAAVTVELSQLLKFNPIPMTLAEIFCANLGGSATMCGDPPNIIIGTSLGYGFMDFVLNTGAMAIISLGFTLLFFYLVCKKSLTKNERTIDISTIPHPKEAILDKKGFILSSIIFLTAIILLVTHSMTGLTVSTIGIVVAIFTFVASPKHILEILKKVDYKTLVFFTGLFVVIGGLEQTGILKIIANFISTISKGNAYTMIAIIIWVSAIASAFIDNIPFAATMIPVIQSLAVTSGIPLPTMAWALSMGTDIGGSATPIGASANVVGTSVVAKAGYPIGWGKYCKIMAPATLIVIAICNIYIFFVYL